MKSWVYTTLLSLVLVTTLEARLLPFEGRIFNGSVAGARQFPYQAWLWTEIVSKSEFVTCGGSIISPRHILSAAHCFRGFLRGPTTIYMGIYDLHVGYYHKDRVQPSAVTIHPNYDPDTLLNDIAVVRLTKRIPIAASQGLIGIIRLPDAVGTRVSSIFRPRVFDNKRVTISGWGRTNNSADSDPPPTLLYQYVNVMPHDSCRNFLWFKYNFKVTESHICSDKTLVPTAGPCLGDSGGPMALNVTSATGGINTYLLGLGGLIFGPLLPDNHVACLNSDPVVFTYVGHYLFWISMVTDPGWQATTSTTTSRPRPQPPPLVYTPLVAAVSKVSTLSYTVFIITVINVFIYIF